MSHSQPISRTKLMLERLFSKPYTPATPKIHFTENEWKQLQAYSIPSGQTFIQWGFPVDSVWFLLRGRIRVSVSSADGQAAVVDTIEGPHLLGVLEAVRSLPIYTASVKTAQECLLVCLSADEFLASVYQDPGASKILIEYLCWLASASMDKSELKAIKTPKELLLGYLYQRSTEQKLPYTITSTKKSISEELHINLRTLYRYLDELGADGYLETCKGKIVIQPSHYEKLKQANPHPDESYNILSMTWP